MAITRPHCGSECLTTMLIGCCMVAAWAVGGGIAHASPPSSNEWATVENCLAIIRQCQMDDGMVRIKADGGPVWTVPYLSNFATMALLAANEVRSAPEDVRRVERWLLWYADNQEADGTISVGEFGVGQPAR